MECGGAVIACDMDIFGLNVRLVVSVCAGYAGGPLYPIAIPVSTGTI